MGIEIHGLNPGGGGPVLEEGQVSQLITGGQVVWEGGLTFRVSAAEYSINGASVSSVEQTITLDAADADDDRIDVIGLDADGLVFKVTGTPATPAGEPSVDPETQLKLVFVSVPEDATAPVVTNTSIYLEGAEWTDTTSGSGWTLDSVNNPRTGTKTEEATAVASNSYIQWESPTNPVDFSGVQQLVLNIRSKAAWPPNKMLRLSWRLAGVLKGVEVTVKDGYWGFDSSITNAYQQVAVPIGQFQLGANNVNQLRATVFGSGAAIGFYLDDIFLQAGVGMNAVSPAVPFATTTVAGIVELAELGENAPNVVVQGNDPRLLANSADVAGGSDGSAIAYEFNSGGASPFTWNVAPDYEDVGITHPGHYYMRDNGNVELFGYINWAPPDGFELTMKMNMANQQAGGGGSCSLIIANADNSLRQLALVSDFWNMQCFNYNGAYNQTVAAFGIGALPIYVRITRNPGTNNWFYWVSHDGKLWRGLTTGNFIAITVAKIGLRVFPANTEQQVAIDWIRGRLLT